MRTSSDPPPYSSSYRIDFRLPPETVEELFANPGLLETALAEYVVMVISTAQELQPREPVRAAPPSEDKALQAQSLKEEFDRKFVNLVGLSLREAACDSESFRDSLNRDEIKVPTAPTKEYLEHKDLLEEFIEPGTCKLSIAKFQKWCKPDNGEQAQSSIPVGRQETEL